MKWYSLQGVPDNEGTSGDVDDPNGYVELPLAGSLHEKLNSSVADSLADSTIAEDNRERFATFHNANLTAADSTFEGSLPHHHSTLLGSDAHFSCSESEVEVSKLPTVGQAPIRNGHSLPGKPSGDDSLYLSSVLGDLSTTSLQTSPDSSFFHPVAPLFQGYSAGLSHTRTSAGTALPHSSSLPLSAASLAGLGQQRHVGTTPMSSSSSLTNVSDLSALAKPTPDVDQLINISDLSPWVKPAPDVDHLWQQLQELKVSTEQISNAFSLSTGVAGGQAAQQKCMCDQLRQLGVDTLTALVESLKCGPSSSPSALRSGCQANALATAAGLGHPCPHATAMAGGSSAQRSTERHAPHRSGPSQGNGVSGKQQAGLPAGVHAAAGPLCGNERTASSGTRRLPPSAAWSHTSRPAAAGHRAASPHQHQSLAFPSPASAALVTSSSANATQTPSEVTMTSGTSSNNWYFYPMGQLYTATARAPSPHEAERRSPLPTVVPLSLQEAFHQQMRSFITRSRERQHSVAVSRYRRVAEKQLRSSGDRHHGMLRARRSTDANRAQTSHRLSPGHYGHAAGAGRRHITHREIVQNARRKYNSLPEVQHREDESRMQREREANRVNAKLFQQRVTASVLGRAPRR